MGVGLYLPSIVFGISARGEFVLPRSPQSLPGGCMGDDFATS